LINEVDVVSEGHVHGVAIGAETIRRKPHAVFETVAKIVNEVARALTVAIADKIGNHEFGVGIRRRPRPSIASASKGGGRSTSLGSQL